MGQQTIEEIVNDKLGRMGRMQVRDAVKRLSDNLPPGETVTTAAAAKSRGTIGLLVATDKRIAFYGQKVVGHDSNEIPYKSMVSVRGDKGRGNGAIIVTTAAGETRFENINPTERYDELLAAIRAQL